MIPSPLRTVLIGGVLLLSAAAAAQTRPSPADPAAPVPPVRYESAFAGTGPTDDPGPGDWRAANDTVLQAAMGPGGGAPGATGHAGHSSHGQHGHGMHRHHGGAAPADPRPADPAQPAPPAARHVH